MPRAARWMALSASHGRAEWPLRPWNVQVALTFPRHPACSAPAVGSMTTATSASRRPGSRASSGAERALGHGQLLAPEEHDAEVDRALRGRAQRELEHHGDRALHVRRAEPVHDPVLEAPGTVALGGHRVEVAGQEDERPVAAGGRPGQDAGVARVARVDPRGAQLRQHGRGQRRLVTRLRGRRPRAPGCGPRGARRGRRPSDPPCLQGMRYCGVDVSAKPGNQQLVTLHERRVRGGAVELVATFYAPGDVAAIARTVRGFGGEAVVGVDAPSGRRLDLLAPGSPLRERLGLPEGRYERSRVCDAILFRRGLPLYPVPAADQALARWEGWMEVGFDLFGVLAPLGLFRPATRRRTRPAGCRGAGRRRGAALRAPVRDLPRRRLLRPARAPAAGEAHALGPAAADRGPAPARRRRRGRRALAPHRRRARRLRRRPGGARPGHRLGLLGRRPARGRDRPPGRRPARALREAAAAAAAGARLGWRPWPT